VAGLIGMVSLEFKGSKDYGFELNQLRMIALSSDPASSIVIGRDGGLKRLAA